MSGNQWRQAADLVIEPDVSTYKYDAFEHAAGMICAGEQAIRSAISEIRTLLKAAADFTKAV
jgi:hypothetical protein